MTKKRFPYMYATLTRCIFTLLTGSAAWLFSVSQHTSELFWLLPHWAEHLLAGVVVYLFFSLLCSLSITHT